MRPTVVRPFPIWWGGRRVRKVERSQPKYEEKKKIMDKNENTWQEKTQGVDTGSFFKVLMIQSKLVGRKMKQNREANKSR